MVAVLAPEGVGRTGNALLSIVGLSKSFGGTQAVRDVAFDVAAGEVMALLGQNGAGKSTVIKILAGIHKADAAMFGSAAPSTTHGRRRVGSRSSTRTSGCSTG